MEEHIRDEVLMTRQTAGLLDGSPLGKIEVIGPDARKFLNFVFYNRMDNLAIGHIRYGFILTEGGAVYDDGVVSCLSEHHFVVSCSSSHVPGVEKLLESWRQDGNDPDRIFIHNATPQWATVTVTGPKARNILEKLALPIAVSAEQFPHMTHKETEYQGQPMRIARVSFSGELSFELSVPTRSSTALWTGLIAAAKQERAGPIGLEAMSVMRAEKGFVIIGKDTDGETMPHDLGFSGPRANKTAAFVGDRSLHTEAANANNRRQWIGFDVPEGAAMIPTGAHLVNNDQPPRSIGVVTSSYHSPSLEKPIALGLLENGLERIGETVTVWHMGKQSNAVVVDACFFDSAGERLNA